MSYFPAFLDIEKKKCLVVGGGNVAAQKIRTLVRCGARVGVVAKSLRPSVQKLCSSGAIAWVGREFQTTDLRGAFLVIAATDDTMLNRKVWETATKQKILVNVVDDPPHCNFIVPSVFRRGKLQIGISTGGSSPAIAKRIRKELADVFGPEYALALDWMGRARHVVFKRVPTSTLRKELFSQLAATDIPRGIKIAGRIAAKRAFDKRLQQLLAKFGKN